MDIFCPCFICDVSFNLHKFLILGHNASVLDFSISSNGRDLLSSSDDGTCRVFDIHDTT